MKSIGTAEEQALARGIALKIKRRVPGHVPQDDLLLLEVLSTRCSWELWPSAATRAAYVQALSEREKCEATLLALDSAPEYRPAQRAFASD